MLKIKLIKPEYFREAFTTAASEAKKQSKISFTHNDTHGSVSGYGFAGYYDVLADYIELTVTKRIFGTPDWKIEKEIGKYWQFICEKAKKQMKNINN